MARDTTQRVLLWLWLLVTPLAILLPGALLGLAIWTSDTRDDPRGAALFFGLLGAPFAAMPVLAAWNGHRKALNHRNVEINGMRASLGAALGLEARGDRFVGEVDGRPIVLYDVGDRIVVETPAPPDVRLGPARASGSATGDALFDARFAFVGESLKVLPMINARVRRHLIDLSPLASIEIANGTLRCAFAAEDRTTASVHHVATLAGVLHDEAADAAASLTRSVLEDPAAEVRLGCLVQLLASWPDSGHTRRACEAALADREQTVRLVAGLASAEMRSTTLAAYPAELIASLLEGKPATIALVTRVLGESATPAALSVLRRLEDAGSAAAARAAEAVRQRSGGQLSEAASSRGALSEAPSPGALSESAPLPAASRNPKKQPH